MNSRLAWKIGSWLTVVFVLVVYVGWHMLSDFNALHQKARLIEAANIESHHLHELELGLMQTVAPVRSFLISGDWRLPDAFKSRHAAMFRILDREPPGQAVILQLKQALEDIKFRAGQIFLLPFPVGNMEGPILMREIEGILHKASQSLAARHREIDQGVDQAIRTASDMRTDMRNDFLLSILVLFLILTGLTAWLYLHMIRPLVHLRRELQKISRGDFDIHCPNLPRDELGELALACNIMGEALQARDAMLDRARGMAAHHEKMRALGLMAAGIAHEVGNPLSATAVSLEVAVRKLGAGQHREVEKQLQAAMDELNRIETIIHNILGYGAEGDESTLTRMDIEPVVQSAIMLARMSPRRKHVNLNADFRASRLYVKANASILRQVLVNLLLNAMDACNKDGRVILSAEKLNGGIALNVCDNGPGIPAELHKQIFTPLFTTKEAGSGTGLGLAISRELMERMHGRLDLVSSNQHGSHFRAWLSSA